MKTILRAKEWSEAIHNLGELGFQVKDERETTGKIYLQNTYSNTKYAAIKRIGWNDYGYLAYTQDDTAVELWLQNLKTSALINIRDALYDTIDGANKHAEICSELNEIYKAKNADYGDSFGEMFRDLGMVTALTRIGDKYNRWKTITKNGRHEVKDETVRDTLMDIANYAIMTLIELDGEGAKT